MSNADRVMPGGCRRLTWKEVLAKREPLVLPAAHDALSARLIEEAGFRAYQVGGFALAGTRYAFPDIDLIHYYEEAEAIRQIISSASLPVMVDAGNGFGDVKNVARTVRGYEEIGVAAIFLEDQVSPVSCGQMGQKEVVPAEQMVGKIQAARDARRSEDTFIMARTDARSAEGLPEAIRRAEVYRKAGAEGVYVEGLRSAAELERVGKALPDFPLATTLMEGGGQLPWIAAEEIYSYGFAMILYPTTVLFRLTRAVQRALADLKMGRPMPANDAVTLDQFEDIVRMPEWADIEKKHRKK